MVVRPDTNGRHVEPNPGKRSVCVARDFRDFSAQPEDWHWVDIYPGSVWGINAGDAPAETINFCCAVELDAWLSAHALGEPKGPLAPYYTEVIEVADEMRG